MPMTVFFPDGPRNVEAVILGRNLIGSGGPPTLAVPKAQPGFRLSRHKDGWHAKPN